MNIIIHKTEKEYFLSTDKDHLDLQTIHAYLAERSYWAGKIPLETVKQSIDHSLCFGVYLQGKQIAFARFITDYATFGYLADVFVREDHRAKGISKMLMRFIMETVEPFKLRKYLLSTLDAHGLYEKFGFTSLKNPERVMEITRTDMYKGNMGKR